MRFFPCALAAALAGFGCGRSALFREGPPFDDGQPFPTDCPSAVEPGAPAPMARSCSTRAGRSVAPVPDHPAIAATVQLPVGNGTSAKKDLRGLAVAASGRAYVTYDPDSGSSDTIARILAAIEPDGRTAWSVDLGGAAPWTPILLPSGNVLVFKLASNGDRSFDERSHRDGAFVRSTPASKHARGDPAVGRDGALYLASYDFQSPAVVEKVAPGSGLRWTSAPLGDSPSQVALGNDGAVLVVTGTATDTHVFALDAETGATRWDRPLDGYAVSGPVVAGDGAILVSLGQQGLTHATLATLEPAGDVRRLLDLGVTSQSGIATPLVARDGTVVMQTWDRTYAIDAEGNVRWHLPTHPNLVWEGVIGSDGRLLLLSGSVVGIDLGTGAQAWRIDFPFTPPITYFATAVAMGRNGVVIGAGGGKLVFAR